jgi:hypothetical protein
MKVLVCSSGSSSLKFSLCEREDLTIVRETRGVDPLKKAQIEFPLGNREQQLRKFNIKTAAPR